MCDKNSIFLFKISPFLYRMGRLIDSDWQESKWHKDF